jgi:hypothetical protein
MRRWLLAPLVVLTCSSLQAQGPLKVEPFTGPGPEELAAPIREELAQDGLRVLDPEGKPWVEIWLRKAVPATERPGQAKGTILFPFLTPGELIGSARFLSVGHDYRDQEILEGVYTLRYGLQPVNGDHLGVSSFRDYVLLVPADDDQSTASPSADDLNLSSSNAAGTNHPAVFLLEAPLPDSPPPPAIVNDEANKRTSVLFELATVPKGSTEPAKASMRLVLIGVGPH